MKRARLFYSGFDPETGEESATADEVIESEPESRETGLVDENGEPIRKPSLRIPLGFAIK